MSDNVNITPGAGDVVAADNIDEVKYQRIKVVLGDDGENDGDVSEDNPMPVNVVAGVALEVELDEANDSVLVYGNDGVDNQAIKTDANGRLQVDINSSALPSDAATETTLAAIDTKLGSTLAVNVGLTDTELRASAVGVDTGLDLSPLATETTLAAIDTKLAGTIDVDTGLTGLATEVTLASIDAALAAPLTVNVGLTDVELRASDVGVDTGLDLSPLATETTLDAVKSAVEGTLTTTALPEAVRIAEDSVDPDIEYFGFAPTGTLTSAASWRIFRLDSSTGLVKEFADGDADYDNEWDDRETLSYA